MRRPGALALLGAVLCVVRIDGYAPPFVSFTVPEDASDKGGYDVSIVGRNFGFLDDDVKVFVNGRKVDDPIVEIPYERIRIKMPPCARCGVVPITVRVGSELSNPVNFTMTNRCVGPVTGIERPVLPSPFSGHENCTICVEAVHLATAVMPDLVTYQVMKDALHGVCDTIHFTQYSVPNSGCKTDLSVACKIFVQSMLDSILDAIWEMWEPNYWKGMLPDAVCTALHKCDPNTVY